MSLSSILLGIWLILLGASWVGWIDVSLKFLGLMAFLTGIIWLIESFRPITITKP